MASHTTERGFESTSPRQLELRAPLRTVRQEAPLLTAHSDTTSLVLSAARPRSNEPATYYQSAHLLLMRASPIKDQWTQRSARELSSQMCRVTTAAPLLAPILPSWIPDLCFGLWTRSPAFDPASAMDFPACLAPVYTTSNTLETEAAVPSTRALIRRCRRGWRSAHAAPLRASEKMRRNAIRRCIPAPDYQPGQQVLLQAKDLQLSTASQKLAPRFLGPYSVRSKINPAAVRLPTTTCDNSPSISILPGQAW
ncbi:uncharacterized protein LOC133548754 [Nerophis ophidion]|uniref:uncharacterized protein LOC133548754 n=1 Tax=Nerophis ophidion TaxID=159077 RepID=UPI002ADF0F91|nr:uncharacterized protein LOC133548754 [Nerophis ophidion]